MSVLTTPIHRTCAEKAAFGVGSATYRTFHQEPCVLPSGERATLLVSLLRDTDDRGLPYLYGSCLTSHTYLRKRKPEGGYSLIEPPPGEAFLHPVKGNLDIIIKPAGRWADGRFIWEGDERPEEMESIETETEAEERGL